MESPKDVGKTFFLERTSLRTWSFHNFRIPHIESNGRHVTPCSVWCEFQYTSLVLYHWLYSCVLGLIICQGPVSLFPLCFIVECWNIPSYFRLTFDIGTNFLFGDYVSPKDSGYLRFSEAFTSISEIATRRIRMSVNLSSAIMVRDGRKADYRHRGSNWRLFEFGLDPMESPMKVINSFIEPIIEKALSESLPGAHLDDNSFLRHLIATHKSTSGIYIYIQINRLNTCS